MNNDNSGGVIFGGVPLDNYQTVTPPVDNNVIDSASANAVVSPVVPVTPVMNEAPSNTIGDNLVGSVDGSIAPTPTVEAVSPVVPVTPVMSEVPSNTIGDNLAGSVDSSISPVPTVEAVSPVIPTVSPVGVPNSVDQQVATSNDGILSVGLPTEVVATPEVSNDVNVVAPVDVADQQVVPSNDGVLGFELPVSDASTVTSTGVETVVPPVANATIDAANQQVAPLGGELLGFESSNESTINVATVVPGSDNVVPETVSSDTVISQEAPSNVSTDDVSEVISVGKYLGYMFLFMIPVVGLIMLIVKALDKKNKNISNYAKAQLFFGLIMSVVIVVFTFIFLKASGNYISDIYNNVTGGSNGSYTVDYE